MMKNKRSGEEMITITPDAIKKLDKNTINLIYFAGIALDLVPEIEKFMDFIVKKNPEFKDKIIFMFGKFDITHFSKKDLLFLKNSIDKVLKKTKESSTCKESLQVQKEEKNEKI